MEINMARYFLPGLFLLTFLVGCSPYMDGYQYVPHPALANIPATQPSLPPPLSVYASIIGVRYEDAKEQLPDCIEVRFQLNNNGPQTVTFDPHTLTLNDGTMIPLAPPILRPSDSVTLAPLQSTTYNAYFPFAPGHDADSTDLNSLQLRWMVMLDNLGVNQAVLFNRSIRYYYYSDPYPYYPYPYPYWGPYYGGVVIVHH